MEREGEKEGEKHNRCVRETSPLARPQPGTWPATQACALTGNQIGDLLVPRLALKPLSHTSPVYILTLFQLNFQHALANISVYSRCVFCLRLPFC